MFVILQKYDFSSKSQQNFSTRTNTWRCLWYCKSTIFQANHNNNQCKCFFTADVCDTAKVRFFKQITTNSTSTLAKSPMFVILQKYDFSSKSQPSSVNTVPLVRCLWYCKSTIFQANHNARFVNTYKDYDVCDTAKVRFFKQITTTILRIPARVRMFVILQKYDFSSKSQQH